MANIAVASELIRGYEYDLNTGVPMSLVYNQARRHINRFEKIHTRFSLSVAAELKQWLQSQLI